MSDKLKPQFSDIILYTSPEGDVHVEVFFGDETFWLSQKRIAELFGKDVRTINDHLKNIFDEGELRHEATIRKFRIVQKEGSRDVARDVDFYNLDAIIAVGYRVNSHQATKFRIWATKTLKEFIVKGFVLDDERLKQGNRFGKDYFDELLERIREIRASERRFYQKITDIYQQCSIDYDKDAEITLTFFKTVQNKLHWAITGKTAAEIIYSSADATKIYMGLTTWKRAPLVLTRCTIFSKTTTIPTRGCTTATPRCSAPRSLRSMCPTYLRQDFHANHFRRREIDWDSETTEEFFTSR